MRKGQIFTVGHAESIPPGRCATLELPDGAELAIYNVNGEFYATANSMPPVIFARIGEHRWPKERFADTRLSAHCTDGNSTFERENV